VHYLFHLGHPAHFHLFKNTIALLQEKNNRITIVIKKKDILEDLLKESGFPYLNILPQGRKDTKLGIALGVLEKDIKLFSFCRKNRPGLLIGTSAEISHIGKLLNIPSIVLSEDDYHVIRTFALMTYPFAKCVLSPVTCDNGKWNNKTIAYKGYHKLAYLHPKRFSKDSDILKKYPEIRKPYAIIRFAKLTAHHDEGIKGINDELARQIIATVVKHGVKPYITSERPLPEEFEEYKLKIELNDIHQILSQAKLFIGDSQSMSVESAMLGVPSIRYSDFAGEIGVLEELEHKYRLTKGIRTEEPQQLLQTIEDFLSNEKLQKMMTKGREKMLQDKIDVTAFFVWFFENFPESYQIMKDDPDYQWKFK
jgi:hypothetical protein